MDPQTVQEIKPLVIRTPDGDIFDVSLMNPKSHSKSIERDQLWHLHRQTGRTLPYDERHELQDLKARENWYEAVIRYAPGQQPGDFSGGSSGAGAGADAAGVEAGAGELDTPAALRRQSRGAQSGQEPDQETAWEYAAEYGQGAASGAESPVYQQPVHDSGAVHELGHGRCGDVLERLEAIVRERRQLMPEGSYTTHLFASGAEKIRKKTGEEAVELILAGARDQIVYEAADLLYHLCVLLVSEGISYPEVCGELRRRHTDG